MQQYSVSEIWDLRNIVREVSVCSVTLHCYELSSWLFESTKCSHFQEQRRPRWHFGSRILDMTPLHCLHTSGNQYLWCGVILHENGSRNTDVLLSVKPICACCDYGNIRCLFWEQYKAEGRILKFNLVARTVTARLDRVNEHGMNHNRKVLYVTVHYVQECLVP